MIETAMPPAPEPTARPGFAQAVRVWFKIGCLSFGGPAGQIALMHRIVVDEKKWLPEARFMHALNFCMLLPGPEAQQLATYTGWLLHGVRGGLAAGILFVLPGAAVMLALSLLYTFGRGIAAIDGALFGIKAAVLVIVVEALIRIGKRALTSRLLIGIAAAAFIGIYFLALPFPLIVALAGFVGFMATPVHPQKLGAPANDNSVMPTPGRWRHAALSVATGLAVWWAPMLLIALTLVPHHVLIDIGLFFSKLAVVTFGGAYAVLAYMAQQAVDSHHWLTAPEMVDALGLAETTPGPLILVTQFVGFLAAFRDAAPFTPLVAGLIGAALTLWVTFVPSMLWIFAGAPFVEELRGNKKLAGALSAITAAVVGVILNLTVWFALHVLVGTVTEMHAGPLRWYSFNENALDSHVAVLAVTAALLTFRFHRSLIEVIAVMAVLGMISQSVAF